MLANIGTTEIIMVSVIMLVLFGGQRIPMFVRGMGESVTEFRKAVRD